MKKYFSDNPEIHHCILSDVWKDRSGRHWLGSYSLFDLLFVFLQLMVGISTQFATEELQIFAPSIAIVELHERHTIENIGHILIEVCNQWGIVPTLSVTDSASNALGSSEMLVDAAEDRLTRTLLFPSPPCPLSLSMSLSVSLSIPFALLFILCKVYLLSFLLFSVSFKGFAKKLAPLMKCLMMMWTRKQTNCLPIRKLWRKYWKL